MIGSCLSEELSCACSEALPLNRETGHSRTVAMCCRLILVLEEELKKPRISLRGHRSPDVNGSHGGVGGPEGRVFFQVPIVGLAQTLTARCGTKESLPPIQLTISNAYHWCPEVDKSPRQIVRLMQMGGT